MNTVEKTTPDSTGTKSKKHDNHLTRLRVEKRNDRGYVDFDPTRIHKALSRAFKETGEAISERELWMLVNQVAETIRLRTQKAESIHVEEVQDICVEQLFAHGYHQTGEAYVLFRRKRTLQREASQLSDDDRDKIDASARFIKTDLQFFQHLSKYARFIPDKNRRETWVETVERVIGFFKGYLAKNTGDKANGPLMPTLWENLQNDLLNMEALPSMRMIQMAGPPAERCNVCIYNCAFISIRTMRDFAEMLYVLMQGTGQGFSVECEYIEELPKIKKQQGGEAIKYQIEDSTEGWCNALLHGMEYWFDGKDVVFDYSDIRPAGAILRTKGGRASGPEPLRELLDFTRERILARQKKRLRSIDVHDISCKIGKIVQVGGVRRAAMISLSDLDDNDMRHAKSGEFWMTAPQRTMANNSAVYEEKPDDLSFMREWVALAESGSGERGIFNRGSTRRTIPKRRKWKIFGTNPCGEILLRSKQFCNLSIAVCRPDDTEETLLRKVRSATIFGTLQSLMTRFHYLSSEWKENCEEERLLGVDLAGAQDCPLLRGDHPGVEALLKKLRAEVNAVNKYWAEYFEIPISAAATCIKPGGNSGVFLNAGHAITGWQAPFIKRHVRVNAIDPMAKFLIDQGVPHCPDYDEMDPANPRVWVFAFPLKAPEGALCMSEVVVQPNGQTVLESRISALEQLDTWKRYKQSWTEHNPSVTINVSSDEWMAVGAWILHNWDVVGGLSFLPRSGRVYPLAPMQEITEDDYNKLVAEFPKVDWEKFFRYESEDNTTLSGDFACVAGVCAL